MLLDLCCKSQTHPNSKQLRPTHFFSLNDVFNTNQILMNGFLCIFYFDIFAPKDIFSVFPLQSNERKYIDNHMASYAEHCTTDLKCARFQNRLDSVLWKVKIVKGPYLLHEYLVVCLKIKTTFPINPLLAVTEDVATLPLPFFTSQLKKQDDRRNK